VANDWKTVLVQTVDASTVPAMLLPEKSIYRKTQQLDVLKTSWLEEKQYERVQYFTHGSAVTLSRCGGQFLVECFFLDTV